MKYLKKWYAMLCLLLGAGMLTSCGMMEDDRSDCPTGLYVSFKYDYNLQRADMFGDHVGGVTLYVFDEAGKLVRVQEEGNTPIARPLAAVDYKMHLSGLQPGKYQFLALAGQKSYSDMMATARPHFVRSDMTAGSPMDALTIRLDREQQPDGTFLIQHHNQPLDTLWHGMHTELVEVFAEKPTYAWVPLVRDTKKINVSLREIDDPSKMDVANYEMKIIDRNSVIKWNNELDETETVVYTPHATWNTDDRTNVILPDGTQEMVIGKMAHADFMTSRLIYHSQPADDAVLTVKNLRTGVEVAHLNVPDILSRLRTSEELYAYTPQEFLDRGYDYKLELFLIGDRLAYLNISISVLGWSKRIQFEDL